MTHHTPPVPTPVDCDTAIDQLWDYLDAELDAIRMARIEAHLANCVVCPPHFEFLQGLLGYVAGARAAEELPGALRARVVAALHAEGYQRAGR